MPKNLSGAVPYVGRLFPCKASDKTESSQETGRPASTDIPCPIYLIGGWFGTIQGLADRKR
jgi:hypothetical protein